MALQVLSPIIGRKVMAKELLRHLDNWHLSGQIPDVRGHALNSQAGGVLGIVQDFLVDTDSKRVHSILLEDGSEYSLRDLEMHQGELYLCPNSAHSLEGAAGVVHEKDPIQLPVWHHNRE